MKENTFLILIALIFYDSAKIMGYNNRIAIWTIATVNS